jgi:acetyltransferase-like isoleucine patch superfamily enzyme
MITPGVKIGDGAVIGMGTIVSKDIPNGAIVVGSQQRIIKYRNMEEFNKKNDLKHWYGSKYE